jgi:glyoxylase-like metal-dependent hydrolase (beta-lactamase superfamily II)
MPGCSRVGRRSLRTKRRAPVSPKRRGLRTGAIPSRLRLKYYGPAHTDCDISVTFVEADILHAADTFWNGVFPFIDYSTGGSIDGMIRAAEANLAATTNKTIVISGHGRPVGNRAQLAEFRDMLVDVRESVATLKRQGRPLRDIIAARPSARYDASWGNYAIDGALYTKTVHEGV